MKKNTLPTALALLMLIFGSAHFKIFATPLSGSYTINATLPATSSNFKNFASALTYMYGPGTRSDGGVSNTAPFGINGPVEFFVKAGTYSERVILNGDSIPGLSSANPLTFTGDNSATTTLTFAATGQPVFLLKRCKYVTLRRLGISNTAIGTGIGIAGSALNNNGTGCRVVSCKVVVSALSASYGINITADTLGWQQTAMKADSITLDSNNISGTTPISITGSASSSYNRGIKITGDTLTSPNYAIYLAGIYNGIEIIQNKISSLNLTSTTGSLININNCISYGPERIRISGNKMNAGGQAITFVNNTTLGSAAYPVLIDNNMITGNMVGIAVNMQNNFFEIYHNSIYIINQAVADFSAIFGLSFSNPGGTLKCKNNLFAVDPGNAIFNGFPVGVQSTSLNPDTIALNCNIYYNASNTTRLVSRNGIWGNTNFKTSATGGDSSFTVTPSFFSTTDLHLSDNTCGVKGANLNAFFPLDQDGNIRPAAPEIGCFEYQRLSLNLRVLGIANALPMPLGAQNLGVRVCNVGTTPVSTFTIAYTVDGGPPVVQPWSGFLGTCDTATVLFTGAQQLVLTNQNRSIKAYVYDPNGTTDLFTKNDTTILNTAMSGTYIVGSAPSDYTTFIAAINDLILRGISGPVILSAKSGTYPAIDLNGIKIKGTSATNRITFDGNNVATISTASAFGISLKNIQYVTIRNFTINNTSGAGDGVFVVGYSSANSLRDGTGCAVKHCTINTPAGGSSYGIRLTGGTIGSRIYGDSVEVDSNTINGGNTGIRIEGLSTPGYNLRFKVRNNTINNASTSGIYVLLWNGMDILNNTINKGPNNISNSLGANGAGSSGIFVGGVHLVSGGVKLRISGNKISCRTNYGISMFENYTPNASDAFIFANNSIVNATIAGMYIWAGQYDVIPFHAQLFHNTIVMDTAALYGVYFSNAAYTYTCESKNNIFAVTASSGSTLPVFFDGSPGGPNALDYNVYYNASGPSLLKRGPNVYNNLTFKTASAGGDSSMNMNPRIVSISDLRLSSGCKFKGTFLFTVPVDIVDSIRNNPPSIGAYEYQSVLTDVGMDAMVSPSFPPIAGLQDLKLRFINNGLTALDSCMISYQLNSGTPVTQKWIGLLNRCDTGTVTFTGSQQINVGTYNYLRAYTYAPNAITDQNKYNDTLNLNFGIPLNGVYTIGGVAPDFANVTAAVAAMNLRGINGAVTFNIRTGTYTEQIILSASITGISATNTITLQSEAGHADSVKLTFSSGTPNNYIIKLNDMSFVRIRSISILPTNTSSGRGIEFIANSSFNTIENCKFGSLLNSHKHGIYGTAVTGGKNVIRNNTFINCDFGIYYMGTSATINTDSNFVDGNNFQNCGQFNIYIWYVSNTRIRNNVMVKTNAPASATAFFGIYGSDFNAYTEITGNKITFSTGGSGISLNWVVGNVSTPSIIANNSVAVSGTGLLTQGGLMLYKSSNTRMYHNSVGYSGTSATASAGGFVDNPNNVDIRNNIFANTGLGPAALLVAPGMMDNNLFHCSGAVVFLSSGTHASYSSLAEWRSFNYSNLNSLFYRPAFTNATNLNPNPADTAVWAINGRGVHLDSTYLYDLNATPRPLKPMSGVPDLGAYEVTPTSTPPMATSNPAQFAPDSTQIFLFGEDSVAAIKWDISVPLPASVTVRQYSGKQPPNTNATDMFMYFYTDILAPSSSYFNLKLYYKDQWLGTVPQESTLTLIFKNTMNVWNAGSFSSIIDPVSNSIFNPGLSNFGLFTGTDVSAPLPVRLLKFSGYPRTNDVVLNWQTTNEVNFNKYVIERSSDNVHYIEVGNVLATSRPAVVNTYTFIDETISSKDPMLYYRLKILDNDGSFEYSKVIVVNLTDKKNELQIVYPNPFGASLTTIIDADADGTALVELVDVFGKQFARYSTEVTKGVNSLTFTPGNQLPTGMYLLKVTVNNKLHILKVMKE